MTDKLKEILTAWKISFDPTDKQSELAGKRLSICNTCDHRLKNRIGIEVCIECGCPISKKIFSTVNNSCPLGKWNFK